MEIHRCRQGNTAFDRRCAKTKDVDFEFDENLSVREDEMEEMSRELKPEGNVLRAKKVRSFANRGVQLADFVSGAVSDRYEYDDTVIMRRSQKGYSWSMNVTAATVRPIRRWYRKGV